MMLLNFLGYYAVWLAIVSMQSANYLKYVLAVFIVNLFVHFLLTTKNKKREMVIIFVTMVCGLLLDLGFVGIEVFQLKGQYLFWQPMIWCTFATTIDHSTKKIFDQKNYVLFLLGALLGPLSYYSAGKLQLLNYTDSFYKIIVHALFWGLFVILLKFIKGKCHEIS